MVALTTLVAAAGLLGGAGLRAPQAPLQRTGRLSMMPSSTPRVPYKYPGMENPVWVDVYNRMYRERIMFLGQGINDQFANTIIAVLLYLEQESAQDSVGMYFNVPGGYMKSGLAIYDTMRIMPYKIQTVNMGISAQVASFLVAGGTKGERFSLPNSRFAMMNPGIDPSYDQEGNPRTRIMQATEMKVEVEEVLRDKKRMLEGFSTFTGRSMELLRADFSRDFYLTAPEAMEYGLIDELLAPKRPEKLASRSAIKLPGLG